MTSRGSLFQISRSGRSDSEELFFILSGEHPTLPSAEIHAIMESLGLESKIVQESYRLLRVRGSFHSLKPVALRSLMCEGCGTVLGETGADIQQISSLVRRIHCSALRNGAESFAVRSIRIRGVARHMRRMELESLVGSLVKELAPGLRVNLMNPAVTLLCVLFDDRFLLCNLTYSKPSGAIARRRPRLRPVFHPATMPPKIARCMVNLTRIVPGAIFADPFCGVGGLLIEAALIGCKVIGLDVDLRMLRGTSTNLRHFKLSSLGYVRADSRSLPLAKVDGMATDPPYGRGSSTHGVKVRLLLEDFLWSAHDVLSKSADLCIAAPLELDLESLSRDAGYILKEKHQIRVHRSLTRQLLVLSKT